jgi:hypothetical protein
MYTPLFCSFRKPLYSCGSALCGMRFTRVKCGDARCGKLWNHGRHPNLQGKGKRVLWPVASKELPPQVPFRFAPTIGRALRC